MSTYKAVTTLGGALMMMHSNYRPTYICYLIALIAHNPMQPEVPPMVYRVMFSPSESITLLRPSDMPECRVMQAVLMKTTSMDSYQRAQEQMVEFVNTEYCPKWIRDRLPPGDVTDYDMSVYEDRIQYYADLVKRQVRQDNVVCHLVRPIYSMGGVYEPEDLL